MSLRATPLTPLALLMLVNAGCVALVEEYLPQWAPVVTEGACRDVAGTYHQKAERSPTPNDTVGYPRLTWLLTAHEYFGGAETPVTLSVPEPHVLQVSAGEVKRYELTGGEAACVDGGVARRARKRCDKDSPP